MTELYIIGTGGAAKEIVQLIEQINSVSRKFSIAGLVDVNGDMKRIDILGRSYALFKEENFLKEKKGVSVVIANGSAVIRKAIYKKFQSFEFPNIIHPQIDLHETVRLGNGNILKIGCILTASIVIGDNNYINRGVQIGHDIVMGHHNVLNPSAILSGGVICGSCNNFGANATVLQYLSIGSNNTLGAGAVLTKDIVDNSIMVGVPAKLKE